MPDRLCLTPEVTDAVASGTAVVGLETTLISHGLPRPRNLEVAREIESMVRSAGAVPATIAVLDGVAHVGLDDDQLVRVATMPDIRKLSVRDLAMAAGLGQHGATTVSATAHLASISGVRVVATGGLGGTHRGYVSSFDESADLETLSKTPITVVSAGVKSILDVAATLQRLETLGIGVVGYGTEQFPGFYRRDSGQSIGWRVDTEEQVCAIMSARAGLRLPGALVVANPVAEEHELDAALHDRVLAEALAEAEARAIQGQAITSFLLDRMVSGTQGRSLEANLQAVYGNVRLAARIADTCASWKSQGVSRVGGFT